MELPTARSQASILDKGLPASIRDTAVLKSLTDEDLLRRVGELSRRSRQAEVELVAHLGEVDVRRLYLREACSSLFAYCTERLHFSEAEAMLRITAARAAREHPAVLAMLGDGRLHLSAVARLAPHLTAENHEAVLHRAVHRSKAEILELVAELAPRPDVPPVIRRLPGRRPGPSHGAQPRLDTADRFESPDCPSLATPGLPSGPGRPPSSRAAASAGIEPLAPARYKVEFTASAALRDKLERLRRLMRPSVPDGDLATIVEQAVTEKLARLEAKRFGTAGRPSRERTASQESRPSASAGGVVRAASRHIPAAVRRAVALRDAGQCAYRDAEGRRCSARERLEFHHRRPFGVGGGHAVDNLALLCRAHNGFVAEVDFGSAATRGRGAPASPGTSAGPG